MASAEPLRQSPRVRNASWSIADVIDFEHLLAEEERVSHSAHDPAAAQLFREKIAPALPPGHEDDRRAVFRAWLDAKRAAIKQTLPGECFAAGWQTLLFLAAVGGLILGGSVPGALMAASGESVNALLFLACTAGIQVAVLLVVFVAWLLRHWLGSIFGNFHPLRAILHGWLTAIAMTFRRFSPEESANLRAALGVFDRRREIYGSLAIWPLLIVTQIFAVAFNIGVLAVMLAVQLALVDRSFHWESTYDPAPTDVHRVVAAIATPWSWAAPHAHPSREEIEASQRKVGSAETVSRESRHAWWPFLAYAVGFYGLLPRAVLLVFATSALTRGLGSLRFQHAEANALWRRLTGPLVLPETVGAQLPSSLSGEGAAAPARRVAGDCVALVASEFPVNEAAIRTALATHFSWQLRSVKHARVDHRRESAALFDELRAAAAGLAAIAVLIPAERDPITAIALFLREIESAVGAQVEVLVLLAGAGYTPADAARIAIWRRFRDLQRLRPGVESWP